MEWIKSLLGLDKIFVRRAELLSQQKRQDGYLNSHIKVCPREISLYLLHTRAQNRDMTNEYNNASMSSCMSLLDKHIRFVGTEQDSIDKLIENGDLCGGLRKYLRLDEVPATSQATNEEIKNVKISIYTVPKDR